MLRRWCPALLLMVLAVGAAAQVPSAQKPSAQGLSALRPKIDAMAHELISAEETVGLVIGVATPSAQVFFSYGVQKRGSDRPCDEHTLFEIGSVTKTFTATVLAEMAARGELALDDPVGKFLPEGTGVPKRGAGEITLEHLATHTSGLPRLPSNLEPSDPNDPYADYTVDRLYAFLKKRADRKGRADPSWSYSNLGVGLLGHALARKAGTSYEELIQKRVSQPLGLRDTTITLSDEQKSRFAQAYNADSDETNPWALGVLEGAGAIRSTASDMLAYMTAQAGLRETPLTSAIQETQRPRVKVEKESQSGLAWIIDGHGLVGHDGQTGGYHASVLCIPAKKVAVVTLANQGSGQVGAVAAAVMKLLQGEEPDSLKLKPTVHVSGQVMAAYAGQYKMDSGAVISITHEPPTLRAQLTGQPKFRVFPESETKFYYKVVDAQLTFERDAEGKVAVVVLHQNGTDMRAPRQAD